MGARARAFFDAHRSHMQVMASSSSVRLCSFPFLAVRGAATHILRHNLAQAYQRANLTLLADCFVSWFVVVDRILACRQPRRLAIATLRRFFNSWRVRTPGLILRIAHREELELELVAFCRGDA